MSDIKYNDQAKKEIEQFCKKTNKLKSFANGCVKALTNFANDKDGKEKMKQSLLGTVIAVAAVTAEPEVGTSLFIGSGLALDYIIAEGRKKRTLVQSLLTPKRTFNAIKTKLLKKSSQR